MVKHGSDARLLRVVLVGLALVCALRPGAAEAQRAVDLQIGSWSVDGPNPTLYSASSWRHLAGPLDFGVRGLALIDDGPGGASLYGLGPELALFRGSHGISPYVVGGVAAAVRSGGSSDFAALWNAGLGVELNPNSWFGLAVEAAYYVEDGGFRGFWNLRDGDRRGWMASAGVSVRWGGSSGGGGGGGAGTPARAPSASIPTLPAYSSSEPAEPLSAAGSALAYDIVDTAIGVMGEPYRWGGTSTDDGFDCSGLVYYAYTSHGVTVPRVSRDQASAGRSVPRDVATLEPGDILLFANGGSNVSHVGLYVGNGRFIHATSSGGVKVSELEASDAYNRWWLERWVGARRVLR